MEVHQDDRVKWEELSREAQLNAACDSGAKKGDPETGQYWPASAAAISSQTDMYVWGREKDDIGHGIAHQVFGRTANSALVFSWNIAYVYQRFWWGSLATCALHTLNEEVPQLFQVWACK
jgi:hypothetical protein